MNIKSTIPDNVSAFLIKASDSYGNFKNDEFSVNMWSLCTDIQSPIEQLFMIAINLVSHINYIDVSIKSGEFKNDNDALVIIPQWRVGKYRIDFAIRQYPVDKIVCVELDGHDFHDRDEKQRRLEKQRDRFLISSGLKVLHFTGSEIVKSPVDCAIEAFLVATNSEKDDIIHPFENY